jgi:hypothetical protein
VTGISIEERFNYWVEKYPAISWVKEHFELVEAPYTGKQRATFAIMNMLLDSDLVAGDGLVDFGEAAVFVYVYFSLVLIFVSGSAYLESMEFVGGLDGGDVSFEWFDAFALLASEIF